MNHFTMQHSDQLAGLEHGRHLDDAESRRLREAATGASTSRAVQRPRGARRVAAIVGLGAALGIGGVAWAATADRAGDPPIIHDEPADHLVVDRFLTAR